jgi:hypothetical protein
VAIRFHRDQIAAHGGFGDREAATNLGHRQETIAPNQATKLLPA